MQIKKLDSGNYLILKEGLEGPMDGWIQRLETIAADLPDFGALSPVVLGPDGKIFWHGGSVLTNNMMPYGYGAGEEYLMQYPGTRETDVVPFVCLLVSGKLMKKQPIVDDMGGDIFEAANFCLTALGNGFKIYSTDAFSVHNLGDDATGDAVAKFQQRFFASSQSFRKKWGDMLRSRGTTPVCYHTGIGQPTGFAAAARGYIKGLTQLGVKVTYRYMHGDPETELRTGDEYIDDVADFEPDMHMPQVVWAQPPFFFKNSGVYKIGHAEFEGETWPKEWVKQCNMMDELWVPTEWDRNKAIKAGVVVPIYVIYQGIDPDYFHPGILPMRFDVPQSFKFIVNAAWLHRKNLPNLIRAFTNEFKKSEDVALVIKTMNVGLVKSIPEEIEKLHIKDESGWVYVKEHDFEAHQMGSFYTGGQCLVLPTHGEAWGLPIFEALACGTPVITTAYGGPNEVLRDDKKKPIPGVTFTDYRLAPANDNYHYLKGKEWAEPNMIQLAQQMREMYTNYAKYKEAAMKGSDIVRQKFAWDTVCQPIVERLEDIYANKLG